MIVKFVLIPRRSKIDTVRVRQFPYHRERTSFILAGNFHDLSWKEIGLVKIPGRGWAVLLSIRYVPSIPPRETAPHCVVTEGKKKGIALGIHLNFNIFRSCLGSIRVLFPSSWNQRARFLLRVSNSWRIAP